MALEDQPEIWHHSGRYCAIAVLRYGQHADGFRSPKLRARAGGRKVADEQRGDGNSEGSSPHLSDAEPLSNNGFPAVYF